MSYNTKDYRKKDWQEFRLEVLEHYGFICSVCGRTRKDSNVVLQVHHKVYHPNKKAWEYEYDDLEVLCKGCHAAEHGHIPPKYGWEYLGEEDLGDLDGTCQNCGSSLRYNFIIYHKNWGILEVGTQCCDYLTDSKVASTLLESSKKYGARLERFIASTRWKETNNGLSITQKGYHAILVPAQNEFYLIINGVQGKKRFSSAREAKQYLFDNLENQKIQDYIKIHKPKKQLKNH